MATYKTDTGGTRIADSIAELSKFFQFPNRKIKHNSFDVFGGGDAYRDSYSVTVKDSGEDWSGIAREIIIRLPHGHGLGNFRVGDALAIDQIVNAIPDHFMLSISQSSKVVCDRSITFSGIITSESVDPISIGEFEINNFGVVSFR